ncbi:Exonuclease SbcC [Richelia intracellularis]|nr:Exonuclease SbcC [Richelia intracellularis]
MQKRLDTIEKKIIELVLDTGRNEQQIENLQANIADLNKQRSKHKFNEERQANAQRRITATQDVIDRLTTVKIHQENEFRCQLERRIQEIFSEIAFVPYIPKISEKNNEVNLVQNTTGIEATVAASTGENQILSLSFIASIIARVREWNTHNQMLMVPERSTFPIVMDSPFGSLDAQYRCQIARVIPQLANQFVLLLTKTQWTGEVETEISPRIGKEYVLTYYSSKPSCEKD